MSGVCPPSVAPAGMLCPISRSRSRFRLLLERHDAARSIEAEDAHRGRFLDRHRLGRDGDVGVAIDVRIDHLVVVHAVQVIAGENQVVVGVMAREVAGGLPDGIGRALIPVGIVGRLLGGQDLDEALAEQVHAVGLVDVPVQRRRVELRQDEDAADIGVQAVADRDVDQPVLAGDRHRGLRSELCEREEPGSLAPAENDRQDFVVHEHRWESPMLHRANGSATIQRFCRGSDGPAGRLPCRCCAA